MVEKVVESDGESMTVYEYDVTEYTNKEFIIMQSNQSDELKAVTDYNIMMGNLEDPSEDESEVENDG